MMKKKNILIYVLFFVSLVIISCISEAELDGIWGYGFSYNIASGLIPYRDFNMVVGPFYSLFFALFIQLFGNYFIFFTIQNSLLYALILLFVYQKIGKKSIFILLLLGTCLTTFGYNTFCAFLVIAILLLQDSNLKYKQIFIGIIIGIIIMTKHNIGFCLALVYLFANRKQLQYCFSLLIPIVPIFIYLIVNQAFISYIDFCFLGLGNFLDNFYPDVFSIPIMIFIFYFLITSYKKTKDIKVLYLLAFQVILFPIIDQGHILPALIPVAYYLFLGENQKIKFYLQYFTIIGFVVSVILVPILDTTISLKNNFLLFQRVEKDLNFYLENYSSYLEENQDKKVYLFLDNAYLIKIYRNENPTFYDLINNGNLGSNEEKYIHWIDEDCKDKECLFILDTGYFEQQEIGIQRSELFKNYVMDRYFYLETLPSGDRVYSNNITE